MFSFRTWSTPFILKETTNTVAMAFVFPIRDNATNTKDKARKAIKYIV